MGPSLVQVTGGAIKDEIHVVPLLLWPSRPLIKHISMIDDINHIYVFIKTFVMDQESLKAVTIYLKGVPIVVLYRYRSMR